MTIYIIIGISLLSLLFVLFKLWQYEREILKFNKKIDNIPREIEKRIKNHIITQKQFERQVEIKQKPLFKQLEELKIKRQFIMGWITPFMLIVAVVALVVNVWVFKENVRINESLNRPYIEIDTSRIKELDISRVNPIEIKERLEKKQPIPYINSLDFSITNVGKLPARYSIDISEFKMVGVLELIRQVNDSGFIFPGQSIEISYDIKGVTHYEGYEEDLKEYIKRIDELLSGNNTNASRIKVVYGYLKDEETDFDFETVVEERFIESVGDVPRPELELYSRKWFVVGAR